MLERLVFTDHDGTLTDSQREMGEYSNIVAEYNAANLGLSKEVSERLLICAKEDILKNPESHGWVWGEEKLIVAASTSDHYLFNQEATRIVLENLFKTTSFVRRKIDNLGGPDKYLNDLFVNCAPKLGVFYRTEARPFLRELAKMKKPEDWAIVTNSDAAKVMKKLSVLNLGFDPWVIGGARKMEVNRNWVGILPAGPYKGFPGYPDRGVELQRETFYNTLKGISGERMSTMIFVEDVAEFVSWIDFLSENERDWSEAKTTLLLTPMTPSWEKNRYSGNHQNRFASHDLMKILDWISVQ